jgi:hypothetical protein
LARAERRSINGHRYLDAPSRDRLGMGLLKSSLEIHLNKDHSLLIQKHGRMARGGHGLFRVSPGPAMPYPSKPCGRAIPETNVRPFQGCRVACPPSSTPLHTSRRMPMLRSGWGKVGKPGLHKGTIFKQYHGMKRWAMEILLPSGLGGVASVYPGVRRCIAEVLQFSFVS